MILNNEDIELVGFCVLRYAFGRKTYVVSWAAEFIKKLWRHSTPLIKEKLHKELVESLKYKDTGMDIDKAIWKELHQYMDQNP